MRDRRIRLGLLVGLLAALAWRPFADSAESANPHGPLLSDCEGALREIVIQYVVEAAPIVTTAYRQFLRRLPAERTVRVLCPDRAAYDHLCRRLGPVACRLEPVFTQHAMTAWARDRWLAFAPAAAGAPAHLLSPRVEAGEALWPERAGDRRVGADLARAQPARIRAERSRLAFDGGDFVADRDTVFVTPRVLRRNLGSTVESALHLREHLERRCGRRVVLLPAGAPDHHAGMFLMPVGEGRVLVGDPSLARALLRGEEPVAFPMGIDWSAAAQAGFDAVATACARAGFRVTRLPVVPGRDGRTWWTWANVVIDQEAGRRVVHMPVFRGAERLNEAAARTWRGLGYEVHPVDCTETFRHFGSLRCLVNVLRRAEDAARSAAPGA